MTDRELKTPHRYNFAVSGLTARQQVLLVLLLVRTGIQVVAILLRGGETDSQTLYLALLCSEGLFALGLLASGGLSSLPRSIIRFFEMSAASLLFCGVVFVNGMTTDYLNSVTFRVSVLLMQIVLMLCMLLISAFLFFLYLADIITVSKKATGVRVKRGLSVFLLLTFMALAGGLPYLLIRSLDSVSMARNCYQMVDGVFVNFEGESQIVKAEDGCTIENSGEQYELNSLPLYFADEQGIMLTKVYCLLRPSLSLSHKVLNLSQIFELDGRFVVKKEGKETEITDFFLYDGRNTYIFFENTSVLVGEKKVEIAPFSYVTAVYNKSVSIYNSETLTYFEAPIGKEALVVNMHDGTGVNVSMDIVYRTDGREQMLFVQPALLEEIN